MALLLDAKTRSGEWGVMVVSLTRGDTLFARNAGKLMQPASSLKLFTAAIALDRFSPAHQFSTDVLRTGPVTPDGVLRGDLVLRGGGDPAFSRRFLPGGTSGPASLLAELVAGSGIRRVSGNLIADATAFEAQLVPDGWEKRYLHSGYAARVSALSLNENLVWIAVAPAPGGQASVWLEPDTRLPLAASVRTVAGRDARIVARTTPSGAIEVRGLIGAQAGTRRYALVVEDPPAFTAGALRAALESRGIQVDGETVFAAAPPRSVVVATLPSPPLARLVSVMNRESINLYAELLFRNVAHGSPPGSEGSAERANVLLQRFMQQKVGAREEAVRAADGSGLSGLNLASPRSLVQLLDYAHRAPWGDTFHASLPVAGESELLRNRMRRTSAQGNLHAKTGTTSTVISLAGYVTAVNGELLAFAFIYNGTDRWNARETIDAIGVTLAEFVRD
jgi:serine-type D-Ala-D-Ala carboxypeptidase/endopeptidase (penicillin-binding protein 4)